MSINVTECVARELIEMTSLLLNRSDVAGLISVEPLVGAMKKAFVNHSARNTVEGQRFFSALPGPGDMMLLAPGLSPGIPAYSVKVHAKFPAEDPGIRGALLLIDLQTGTLLAVMDSTYLTAVRTGLSAAMATHTLARKSANSVAVIGAGVQGRSQLRYLSAMRSITRAAVYDTSEERSEAYLRQMSVELGIKMHVSPSVSQALAGADIVLCATWEKDPVIMSDMIKAGTHITTLGADQPGESEIDAALIKRAVFVCDNRNLALSMGAIGGAKLGVADMHAELGEVLSGQCPGREADEQISIYGAVGVPFQDLVIAWHVYQNAQDAEKEFNRFDFSS